MRSVFFLYLNGCSDSKSVFCYYCCHFQFLLDNLCSSSLSLSFPPLLLPPLIFVLPMYFFKIDENNAIRPPHPLLFIAKAKTKKKEKERRR